LCFIRWMQYFYGPREQEPCFKVSIITCKILDPLFW
jgi:hypothetical protein